MDMASYNLVEAMHPEEHYFLLNLFSSLPFFLLIRTQNQTGILYEKN